MSGLLHPAVSNGAYDVSRIRDWYRSVSNGKNHDA